MAEALIGQIPGLTMGRMVHYCNGPSDERRGEPEVFAAVVTKVHPLAEGAGVVDLTVFMPGTQGYVTEAPFVDGAYKDRHWTWIPKV